MSDLPARIADKNIWGTIAVVAPAMCKSGFFGVQRPEQAMAIMLKGYELGLTLTASFEFIAVIQGKPALSPRGMLALLLNHPDFDGQAFKVDEGKDYCKVTMARKNGVSYTASFTMDDAKQAGLIKAGGGWQKYPKNMLRWRAMGFCADVVFPDVLGGMKRSDELGADLTIEGDTIEGTARVIESEDRPERIQTVAEPESNDQDGKHWSTDKTRMAKFQKWYGGRGLSDKDVADALGHRPLTDFSEEEVVALVKSYPLKEAKS